MNKDFRDIVSPQGMGKHELISELVIIRLTLLSDDQSVPAYGYMLVIIITALIRLVTRMPED